MACQTFNEPLLLRNIQGSSRLPIVISSYGQSVSGESAVINTSGFSNGLLQENCSFIEVSGLDISASPGEAEPPNSEKSMRYGVLITTSRAGLFEHIYLTKIGVHDVFYNKEGYARPAGEVQSANGTQNYGWGIRIINNGTNEAYIKDIRIDSSRIENVSHTGINFTELSAGHILMQRAVRKLLG